MTIEQRGRDVTTTACIPTPGLWTSGCISLNACQGQDSLVYSVICWGIFFDLSLLHCKQINGEIFNLMNGLHLINSTTGQDSKKLVVLLLQHDMIIIFLVTSICCSNIDGYSERAYLFSVIYIPNVLYLRVPIRS